MTAHVKSLASAICLAALAVGCSGGGGENPTGPNTPAATTTLALDFSFINVVDDCDGIEGDGDFDFDVSVITASGTDAVYRQVINLGPGGRTAALGRRTYEVDAVQGSGVKVRFIASELDKTITGQEYNDDRLNNATSEFRYVWDENDAAWSKLGREFKTLGTQGCMVSLSWTADPL